MEALIEMVQPQRIVAIGRDASVALADLGVTAEPVRHPSYGGQAEFMAGMFALYAPSLTGLPLLDDQDRSSVRH